MTEHCTIAFPQEKAVGGKMIIYAFMVDTLEECYETPDDGLQRWQMQLGEEDEGYLRWLQVAQPGDRPHYELTLEDVTLDPERVSRSTWKFLVCKGRQMTKTVWLTAARAWNMPVSRLSTDAATRLGLTERPNDWCQVRPCNAAGRQEDGFLAKIASVLEIAPPEYPTERRPRELNFRKPDVVIGTRDWETVERFLCNVEPDKIAGLRETRKHHVRIVLQSGERWYLNLLVSETARRSRITLAAAPRLGRGSLHDKRMHLRDVNGKEVSISVDVVDTTKELLEGEDSLRGSQKPHMVLSPGDERRIQGMMLTGWMGRADLLKGWASQGKKRDPPASEVRGKGAGEQAYLKHLKVKTEGRTLRISALFDRNVPDTTIGYGAATILGLKGGRNRQWVTTAEGNQGLSYAWYDVPLQDMGGHAKQVKASSVLRTASVKNAGEDGEAYGDSPGGALGPAREWKCIDLVIGQDNMNCKPEGTLGWQGWPKGGCLVKRTGDPGDYARVKARDPSGKN